MIVTIILLSGVTLFFLLCALSTGNPVYLLVSLVVFFSSFLSLLSVLVSSKTLHVSCEVTPVRISRGEKATLVVTVRHKGLLPIAPLSVCLTGVPGLDGGVFSVSLGRSGSQRLTYEFTANHVGLLTPGVESYVVKDVLGIFSKKIPYAEASPLLQVLPVPFPVDQLLFSPGDTGAETMARASEDITSPSDVRAYQPGDPLKKIQWKLYLRKKELLVRRYEEPELPDALVLLDCSRPAYPQGASEEQQACVRDALYEVAASVTAYQLQTEHPVRLPLQGKTALSFEKSMGLGTLLTSLSALSLTHPEPFERVLLVETRNLLRTGATAVITSNLTSNVVDMVINIRRAGPYVRLFLVSYYPEAEETRPFVSRLQMNDVQVCYVTPANGQ